MNDDLISRQEALDWLKNEWNGMVTSLFDGIKSLPSAQTEPHYCRECKWIWCHINVDKHGKSETYWRCLNWDGETDEEGYCHEWERRTDG